MAKQWLHELAFTSERANIEPVVDYAQARGFNFEWCSSSNDPNEKGCAVEREEWQARAEAAEEALRFYADPAQYEVDGPLRGGAWGSPHYPIQDDKGASARGVLDG